MTSPSPSVRHSPWLELLWRWPLAAVLGLTAWVIILADLSLVEPVMTDRTGRVIFGDIVLAMASGVIVLARRRWPLTIALVLALMSAFSLLSSGFALWALVSVATGRRARTIVPAMLAIAAGGTVVGYWYTGEWTTGTLLFDLVAGVLMAAVCVGLGYSIGSRRALMDSYRERAETVEREQVARLARAQSAERTRIAREMHDVLAHRISLVTMHSGLLSYRPDLPEQERRAAVAAIDTNARAALTDLREVLGVLRDPDAVTAAPQRPQSDLSGLTDLVDETRSAGMRVTLTGGVDPDAVPESIGRTAYRVVQEGLTNARKHAPGTAATVSLDGGVAEGLTLTVTNPRSVQTVAEAPVSGAGLGLLGLAERVELAGGRIEHGWRAEGEHHLTVWLPWSA